MEGTIQIERRVVSRAFHASKFVQALRYKELVNGYIRRFIHPTMGVMYEVLLNPSKEERDGKEGFGG